MGTQLEVGLFPLPTIYFVLANINLAHMGNTLPFLDAINQSMFISQQQPNGFSQQ